MPQKVSSSHVDEFLKREQQAVERLSAEMGKEVVAKFDRLLLRDIIYERKESEISEILGEGAVIKGHRYRVMINMHTVRQQQEAKEPPLTRRERRRYVAQLRVSGQSAIQRLETDIIQNGGEVLQSFWFTHSVVADLTSEQVEKMATREDVKSVIAVKLQPVTTLNVSRPLIQADQVENNLGFDGTNIDVAVLDTGVDSSHPALAGIVVFAQDFTGEGIGDNYGHGTHCAGIIASQDKTMRGIAPGVRIWSFKMIDQNGNSQPDWATAAIEAAVSAEVDIASNSWGWSHANGAWIDPDFTCVLCTAADNAVMAGVVFVVAAGNEDNDTCFTYDTHIRCPGNAVRVITVGASDDSDNMASFSSIGPSADGRIKPEVVAPGVDICSCQATGTSLGSSCAPNFISISGTSMACPHVAGVAALMLEKNRSLTPGNVKAILVSTAVDIGGAPLEMGAGRVDALAAVNDVP